MQLRKILLVEDHEDTRELMAIFLTEADYVITTASSMMEALMLAGSEQFDLFVLDSRLPDGTGVELCERIRQRDQTTPILFCSALAFEKNKDEAFASGAQKYLVKPVDLSFLLSTVDELVRPTTKISAEAKPRGPEIRATLSESEAGASLEEKTGHSKRVK